MTNAPSLTVTAPGKVNLGLRVAARRVDGFQELDTIFATISLHDDVTVALGGEGVHGNVEDARAIKTEEALPGMTEGNLAWRAADAWLRAAREAANEGDAPIPTGVRIDLVKRIPIAAGLGGGSSDAAAVLRALDALQPGRVDVMRVARELGSDVPFFVAGYPSARGRGRGERLTPVELPSRWLVLHNPGISVPVREAYASLAAFGPPLDHEAMQDAWRSGASLRLRNDLQPGVTGAYPEVRDALNALREVGLEAPTLSGSGATCFGVAPSEDAAHDAAGRLMAMRPGAFTSVVGSPWLRDDVRSV